MAVRVKLERGGLSCSTEKGMNPLEKIQHDMKIVERMVSTHEACEALGVGYTYMTQVKTEMGIKGQRRFFLSDVERHLRLRLRRRPSHRAAAADKNGERSLKRAPKTSLPLTHGH